MSAIADVPVFMSPDQIVFTDDDLGEGYDLILYAEICCPTALTAYNGEALFVVTSDVVANGLPVEYILNHLNIQEMPQEVVDIPWNMGKCVDPSFYVIIPPLQQHLNVPAGNVVHSQLVFLWDVDGKYVLADNQNGELLGSKKLETYKLMDLGKMIPFKAPFSNQYIPVPPPILSQLPPPQ